MSLKYKKTSHHKRAAADGRYEGGDNRLAVVMKQHSFPNIRCVPAPGFVPSAPNRRKMLHACRAIESDMPATKATRVFGPEGSPGVAVDLPRGFSGDRGI